MDFGILFFVAFVAIWIFAFRSRKLRSRRPSRLSSAQPATAPQQVTVVAIEDPESAITGVMAVTGASRDEALARLSILPTTIWVPAADFATTLDIFAASGMAYATGALAASEPSPRASELEPSKTVVPPPLDFDSPAAPADVSPDPTRIGPMPIGPMTTGPMTTGPAPADPRNPDRSGPELAAIGRDTSDRGATPSFDHPPPLPESDAANAHLGSDTTAAAWIDLEPSELSPEVAAALDKADRSATERTLRRLSMNGSHEADVVLGTLLVEWGRRSEGEGLFRGRAQEDPTAANNLGVLNEQEGRLSEARRHYDRAAQLGSGEGAVNLARLR